MKYQQLLSGTRSANRLVEDARHVGDIASARGVYSSEIARPIDRKRSGPTENVPLLSPYWRLIPIAVVASLVAADVTG